MPADRLGRYMKSPAFLARANAAVVKAAHALDAKGISLAYLDRKTGRIIGSSDNACRTNGSCEGRRTPDILNSGDPIQGAENER